MSPQTDVYPSYRNTMMQLSLLGQFRASTEDDHPITFPSHKTRALFAYLATERKVHSRIKLATLFWPDSSTANARNSVRVTLFRLRKVLGAIRPNVADIIQSDRIEVSLTSGLWCDVNAFQNLWEEIESQDNPSSALIEEAIDLYSGEFLTGFPAGISDGFDDWLLLTRQQLHSRVLQLLDRLIEQELAAQNYAAVVPLARRQISLEAWHEIGYKRLMLAHANLGQKPMALRAFETCCEVLEEELGVEPDEELVALANALRDGTWQAGVATEKATPVVPAPSEPVSPLTIRAARHNLPQALPTFVPRYTEIKEIEQLLFNEARRWVTLVGPGGMGKSRLAIEAARQMQESFADGVWFVELAGLQSTDNAREQIASTIANVLSLSRGGKDSAENQLKNYLKHKEILLILDNFETILDGADIVYDLLNGTTAVSIICTSREPLYFQAEYLLWLDGLEVPDPALVDDDEILSYEAVQLFVERAGRLRRNGHFDGAALRDVVNICEWLSGSPLGIELAATWTLEMSVDRIWQTLQSSFDLLSTRMRDVPQRHQSMRTVLLHSWERLDQNARALLMKLSVFRGGFSYDALFAVCKANMQTLNDLIDKSLVEVVASDRYRLHEVVRQFSAENLTNSAEQNAVEQRHAHYYLDTLIALSDELVGEHPHIAAAHTDITNTHAAWHYMLAAEPDSPRLAHAVVPLSTYHQIRSLLREGDALFGRSLETISREPASQKQVDNCTVRARLLVEQARFKVRVGQSQACLELLTLPATDNTLTCDQWAAAAAPIVRAEAYWRVGKLSEAGAQLDEARVVLDSAEFPHLEGSYLYNCGVIQFRLGAMDEGQRLLQQVLAQWRFLNQTRAMATTLNELGHMALRRQDFEKSTAYMSEALSLHRIIDDLQHQAHDLNNLALVDIERKRFNDAKSNYDIALGFAKRCGDISLESLIYHNMGWLETQRGEYATGLPLSKQALSIRQQSGDVWGEIFTTASLGFAYKGLGDSAESFNYFERALSLCHTLDAHPMQATIEQNLSLQSDVALQLV